MAVASTAFLISCVHILTGSHKEDRKIGTYIPVNIDTKEMKAGTPFSFFTSLYWTAQNIKTREINGGPVREGKGKRKAWAAFYFLFLDCPGWLSFPLLLVVSWTIIRTENNGSRLTVVPFLCLTDPQIGDCSAAATPGHFVTHQSCGSQTKTWPVSYYLTHLECWPCHDNTKNIGTYWPAFNVWVKELARETPCAQRTFSPI